MVGHGRSQIFQLQPHPFGFHHHPLQIVFKEGIALVESSKPARATIVPIPGFTSSSPSAVK